LSEKENFQTHLISFQGTYSVLRNYRSRIKRIEISFQHFIALDMEHEMLHDNMITTPRRLYTIFIPLKT